MEINGSEIMTTLRKPMNPKYEMSDYFKLLFLPIYFWIAVSLSMAKRVFKWLQ